MRLVVGLGNPGGRYASTRHNVGFRAVERLGRRHGIELEEERFEGRFGAGWIAGHEVALLLPGTFMNASGRSVAAAVEALGLEDPARHLIVVLDDADLPFGRLRLRARGSDGGHNGLADVLGRLGSQEVPRLRFGIGRPGEPVDTVDWVLAPFAPEEERRLGGLLERAAEALECFLEDGAGPAMSRFNGPPPD